MKILHVGSFTGNIGDNANHFGFRNWIKNFLDTDPLWEELEIREFYRNERKWDESFVSLANSYDLIVFGGGNYFELWVEKSPTGTSIEIPPEHFKKINTPMLFNGLGSDLGKGYSSKTVKDFDNFLNIALYEKESLVTVRNDGSLKSLKKIFGDKYIKDIHEVPDAGFFISDLLNNYRENKEHKKNDQISVAINVAGDMPEIRFSELDGKTEIFSEKFARFLEETSQIYKNIKFIFIPHIYKDLEIISEILFYLSDRLRRNNCEVFKYGPSESMYREIINAYNNCDIVLANRFHANVCPIGIGKKTIALANYVKIFDLYESIGSSYPIVNINSKKFNIELRDKFDKFIVDENISAEILNKASTKFSSLREDYKRILIPWLRAKKITR